MDPHAAAIGLFPEIEHPEHGAYRTVNAPMRFQTADVKLRSHRFRIRAQGGGEQDSRRETGLRAHAPCGKPQVAPQIREPGPRTQTVVERRHRRNGGTNGAGAATAARLSPSRGAE
jgi:hypothetical protein